MTTPKDVADWMLAQLTAAKYLEQGAAVYQIQKEFGDAFVYQNANGNLAINRKVLAEFKKLTEGKAVWDRSDHGWRLLREGEDYEGRQVE
jgi:hypothetical protein